MKLNQIEQKIEEKKKSISRAKENFEIEKKMTILDLARKEEDLKIAVQETESEIKDLVKDLNSFRSYVG